MRTIAFLSLLTAFFLAPAFARAEEEKVFNYPDILHTYWKMVPPNTYDMYLESYAKEFPELVPAEKEKIAEVIKENVDDVDLEDTIVAPLTLEIGKYIEAQQAFLFTPFTSGVFIPSGPKQTLSNLPFLNVRFSNGPRIRSLPMPPETAAKIGGTEMVSFNAEVRFLPKKASALSKELKGQITQIILRRGGMDVVDIRFDEETGDMKDVKYLGE